jgi:glycosyltransferase involved in cell wall biosynthesis
VEILMRALPGLDAETVLIGDGPLLPSLEATAREPGVADRVRSAGEVTDEDLLAWYRACDALVRMGLSREIRSDDC